MTGNRSFAPHSAPDSAKPLDVMVIGAGFAGIYAVYRFTRQGLNVLCIEAAPEVGGVWCHNRYPGARCDLQSIDYSYSFSEELQREWRWSQRYAPQAEIQAYLKHVTDHFDLRRHMLFDTRVTGARRDESRNLWTVSTDTGRTFAARFVVLATGPLSIPKDPDFPGYALFKGEKYQTSRWPSHPVTFAGKWVGVIGTGSSGLQTITEVAKLAAHLTVFQRTPAYTAPARNRPLTDEEYQQVVAGYPEYRRQMKQGFVGAHMFSSGKKASECTPEEQRRILDDFWEEGGLGCVSTFTDVLIDDGANEIVANYMRERMGERIVDPRVRERLLPRGHSVGSRRPCCDSGYLDVFNQPNVELVDLRATPIERFTESGVDTSERSIALDMVIVALGFDALSGAPLAINPVNGRGQTLAECWHDGAMAYLGLNVAGFPNMFFVNGPGATSLFGNVPLVAEHDVDWIGDCIDWLGRTQHATIEAVPEAQRDWMAEVAAIGNATVIGRTESWFTGANISGKKRGVLAYMGGFSVYAARCREVAAEGYKGFVTDLKPAPQDAFHAHERDDVRA